jgi:hypothetical protein
MSEETAPAWQVRDWNREELLVKLKEMVTDDNAAHEERLDFYSILLDLLRQRLDRSEREKRLSYAGCRISREILPQVSWHIKTEVFGLFRAVSDEINNFQRSDAEGLWCFSMLFAWAAREFIEPFCKALLEDQKKHPKHMYGVEDPNALIPYV